MKILIVKISSLGDIVQSLIVLSYLKEKIPGCTIDWIAKKQFISFLGDHPLLNRSIEFSMLNLLKLRKQKYDLVFDLQGNAKSGLITFFSKGKEKIGYGKNSVREWPNLLVTHKKYCLHKEQNISDFYLGLIKAHFRDSKHFTGKAPLLNTSRNNYQLHPVDSKQINIMVCSGSKWENKKIATDTMRLFLQKIQNKYNCHFFLPSGSDLERKENEKIGGTLKHTTVLDQMSISSWQHLMSKMDMIIAMDSSSLHLCATTDVASFSIFGPTSSRVFKPKGDRHHFIQGSCPYKQRFTKQCPKLRTCKSGACIKDLSANQLFDSFIKWEKEQPIFKKKQIIDFQSVSKNISKKLV